MIETEPSSLSPHRNQALGVWLPNTQPPNCHPALLERSFQKKRSGRQRRQRAQPRFEIAAPKARLSLLSTSRNGAVFGQAFDL